MRNQKGVHCVRQGDVRVMVAWTGQESRGKGARRSANDNCPAQILLGQRDLAHEKTVRSTVSRPNRGSFPLRVVEVRPGRPNSRRRCSKLSNTRN